MTAIKIFSKYLCTSYVNSATIKILFFILLIFLCFWIVACFLPQIFKKSEGKHNFLIEFYGIIGGLFGNTIVAFIIGSIIIITIYSIKYFT